MGKSQYKKKARGWRHNPIRVPDTHLGAGKGEGKVNPAKERQMLPILEKLKAPEASERTWACAAISSMIQNDPATRRLFQSKNVVGALIERLTDNIDEVIVEASGALRNLAIDGGYELCGEMFNKGLMTHLNVLVRKIQTAIDAIAPSPESSSQWTQTQKQDRQRLQALTENVLSMIWSLAETSPKVSQAVNAAGVEVLLLKVAAAGEVMGMGCLLSTMQALYALTQDNLPFVGALLEHSGAIGLIKSICGAQSSVSTKISAKAKGKNKAMLANGDRDLLDGSDPSLLIRLFACGVLRNVAESGLARKQAEDFTTFANAHIFSSIPSLLAMDLSAISELVVQTVQELSVRESDGQQGEAKPRDLAPHEKTLSKVEQALSAVSLALELLTGICAGLEDVELPGEGDMEEDEDMDEPDLESGPLIEVEDDDGLESNGHAEQIPPSISLPHSALPNLPARLSRLAQLTPLSFPPLHGPSPHPPTTSLLSVIHLRALEALNNIFLTVAAKNRQPSEIGIPCDDLWLVLTSIASALLSEPDALHFKGQEFRLEVLEATVGCMWALAKLSQGTLNSIPAHLDLITRTITLAQSPARPIELIAILAARANATLEETQAVSSHLTSLLASPVTSDKLRDAEVRIAAINGLIDIFSDETKPHDPIFAQSGYADTLSNSTMEFRKMVKGIDRRTAPDLRLSGEEAHANLVAFIKYRRSL